LWPVRLCPMLPLLPYNLHAPGFLFPFIIT
jgi:hypothetical protein